MLKAPTNYKPFLGLDMAGTSESKTVITLTYYGDKTRKLEEAIDLIRREAPNAEIILRNLKGGTNESIDPRNRGDRDRDRERARQVPAVAGGPGPGAHDVPMKPENVKCPKCGGPMTSKVNKATRQRFWGCNGYPKKCNGTRDTDGNAPKPRGSF